MTDLYIKNALIVTESETFNGGLIIQDGKITQVIRGDAGVKAGQVLDCGGNVLFQ